MQPEAKRRPSGTAGQAKLALRLKCHGLARGYLLFKIGFSELTGFIGFSGQAKMGYKEEFIVKEQQVKGK